MVRIKSISKSNQFLLIFVLCIFSFIATALLLGCNNSLSSEEDSHGTWTQIESGVSTPLLDIAFGDDSVGWIVGENGTILKTNDKGSTWEILSDSSMGRLYVLDFINIDIGFTIDRDRMFKTVDGGLTWTQPSVRNLGGGYYVDIHFVNREVGFVVGGEGEYATDGFILKTTDGGANWYRTGDESYPRLTSISFIGEQQGWVCGSGGTILVTNDAGDTWFRSSLLITPGPNLSKIQFVDPSYGWTSSRDDYRGLYWTKNGGETWSQITESSFSIIGGVQSSHFIDRNTGWLCNFPFDRLLRTNDSGSSWEYAAEERVRVNSIEFQGLDAGLLVGNGGVIYKYAPN